MAKQAEKAAAKRKGRPVGGATYTVEMRAALVQAVRQADKTGLPRMDVYKRFAAEWTEQLGKEVEVNNVARTYQNYKDKFTKDGKPKVSSKKKKASGRRSTKPSAKSVAKAAPAEAVPAFVASSNGDNLKAALHAISSVAEEMAALRSQIAELQAAAVDSAQRAAAAEARLEKIRSVAS